MILQQIGSIHASTHKLVTNSLPCLSTARTRLRVIVIRYDTIEEFNVMDSKAEYSALSSTLSQKLKQTNSAPLIQYRLRSLKSVRKE